MKHHTALILIGFLSIAAVSGCGAHDGAPDQTVADEGTVVDTGNSGGPETLRTVVSDYRTKVDRSHRAYRPSDDDGAYTRSCCDAVEVEAEIDATVYVSPSGSDDALGTHDAPVLSLTRAIRLAAERGYSVRVRP